MKQIKALGLLFTAAALTFSTGVEHDWIKNYDYTDKVLPSQNPPGNLEVKKCPMFVTIGFDDNSLSGLDESDPTSIPAQPEGLIWAREFFKPLKNNAGNGNPDTYDGTPVRVAFYNTTYYSSGYNGDNPALIRKIWNDLYTDGHEAGNHTQSHSESLKKGSASVWANEVATCMSWLTKPLAPEDMPLWKQAESSEYGSGIPQDEIVGFRTPFLAYGGPLFPTLKAEGLIYDCTIEEGNSGDHDGKNFRWPYTLDEASPGHLEGWSGNPSNPNSFTVPEVPGLWELPNHVAVIPTIEESKKYGVNHSIKETVMKNIKWFDENSNKMTMFDYNLWAEAKLSNEEVLCILKYNLDLRLAGNRAPLMIGAHTEYFHSKKSTSCTNAQDVLARQKVFEDFVTYALSKPDVRVVRPIDIISWCRDPKPLTGTAVTQTLNSAATYSFTVNNNDFTISSALLSGKSQATIAMYNAQGRQIAKRSVPVAGNEATLTMDNNVSSGLYFVTVDGMKANSFIRR